MTLLNDVFINLTYTIIIFDLKLYCSKATWCDCFGAGQKWENLLNWTNRLIDRLIETARKRIVKMKVNFKKGTITKFKLFVIMITLSQACQTQTAVRATKSNSLVKILLAGRKW